jgi:transposase
MKDRQRMRNFNFHSINRSPTYLNLPPDLKEWLPEGDLAWFMLDATEQMDLKAFYRNYRTDGQGNTAFEPAMMISLLLYAYCLGIHLSRKFVQICTCDIGFRVIAAKGSFDPSSIMINSNVSLLCSTTLLTASYNHSKFLWNGITTLTSIISIHHFQPNS